MTPSYSTSFFNQASLNYSWKMVHITTTSIFYHHHFQKDSCSFFVFYVKTLTRQIGTNLQHVIISKTFKFFSYLQFKFFSQKSQMLQMRFFVLFFTIAFSMWKKRLNALKVSWTWTNRQLCKKIDSFLPQNNWQFTKHAITPQTF